MSDPSPESRTQPVSLVAGSSPAAPVPPPTTQDTTKPVSLVAGSSPAAPVPPPTTQDLADGETRHFIAWSLLAIFAGSILAGFATVWSGIATESAVKDFLTPIITAVVGLLGSVMGFYYGTKASGHN
jgi:hypothetical protein